MAKMTIIEGILTLLKNQPIQNFLKFYVTYKNVIQNIKGFDKVLH